MTGNKRYEVFDKVETTPYGIVWEGYDHELARDVVVVELMAKLAADPGRWEVVWRQIEALSAAKLEHSVRVLDAVKSDRLIVLEKLRGDLQSTLKGAPMQLSLARSVLRRALRGLQMLHEQGIIHGDLKPSHLMYNDEGFIRISFSPGLKLGDEVLKRSVAAKYTVPELVNPEFGPVGGTVDLYQLGFSLLELLGGARFEQHFQDINTGPHDADVAWMRWHGSPQLEVPKLKDLRTAQESEGFEDLDAVLGRLVSKRVDERFASAGEALAAVKDQPEVKVAVPAAAPSSSPPKDIPAMGAKVTHVGGGAGFGNPQIPGSGSRPPSKKRDSPKPWTQEWINAKLQDKRILYALIGVLVVPTLGFLFLYNPSSGKDSSPRSESTANETKDPDVRRIKVQLDTEPDGASLTVDRTQKKLITPCEIDLPFGKYDIVATLQGYETAHQTLTLDEDASDPFALKIALQKIKAVERESKQPSPQTPTSPEGFTVVPGKETDIDGSTRRPRHVISDRFKGDPRPLELVLISGGKVPFGVASSSGLLFRGELPQADAAIAKPYYISLTEVTNAQFAKYVEQAGNHADMRWRDSLSKITFQPEVHPVVNVSFDQAMGFCQWIAPKTGRLPTEAEWEWAARQDGTRMYPWGPGLPRDSKQCNLAFPDSHATVSVDATDDVTPNGIRHMFGNVAEWCMDIYAAGKDEDPQEPGVGRNHSIRGASFLDPPVERIRLTMRANSDAAGRPDVGFRVVVPLD